MGTPAINRYAPLAPGSSDVSGLQSDFASASNRIGELANFIATLTADIAAIQALIAQLQAEMAALEVPDPAKFQKMETRLQGSPPVPVQVQVLDTSAFNAAMARYQSKLQSLQSRISDAQSKLAAKENELANKQADLAKAKADLAAAQKKLEQALANDQKKLEEQRRLYEEQQRKADEAQKRALEAQAQAQKAQDDLQRARDAVDRMVTSANDLGTKTDDASLKTFKDDSDRARTEANTALTSAKNHLPRTENGQTVPPLAALSSTDILVVAPKLSSIADGLTAQESGLMLELVGVAPGEASREALDMMETYWRAAGFSEDDIALAMMNAGGGDQAEVDAAARRIRELLDESGTFGDVTHDELNQINDIIEGLNRVETRAVFDLLTDAELGHWGDEINSGAWFGAGGLSGDEKRELLDTIADRLDSRQLVEFSEKVLRSREDTLRLAESIGRKSSDYTTDAFIAVMTTPTAGFVSRDDYALLAAIDPRPQIPQITGDARADATAIADSLAALKDDPQLQEQFLNYFLGFDGISDPIMRSTLELDAAQRQLFADVLGRAYDRDPTTIGGYVNRISDAPPGTGTPVGSTGEFSGGFANIIRESGNTELIHAYALYELQAADASVDDSGRALNAATALAGLPPTGAGSLQEFLANNSGPVSVMMRELGGRLGGPATSGGFPNPFIANPALGDLLERAALMKDASGQLVPEALELFESALPALGDNYVSLQGAATFILGSGDQIDRDLQVDFLRRLMRSPIGDLVEADNGKPIIELLVTDPTFAPMSGVPAAERQGVADAYLTLLNDEKFGDLDAGARYAIVAQAINYPSAGAIENLRHLAAADWFDSMSTEDQERSAKMVAYVTTEAEGVSNPDQRDLLLTSLGQFLPPDGTLKLEWKTYSDPPGQITYGSADSGTLWLNSALIPDGDGMMPATGNARNVAMDTMPHEVNHLMTGHTDAGTYDRFIDEYRAFYVGFMAENGREPTRAEAWERIDNQLNLPAYSHLADAARDRDRSLWDVVTGDPGEPSEDSRRIVEFAGQFYPAGSAPDPNDLSSGQQVINDSSSMTPSDPSGTAPLPDPVGNMDNSGEPG